EGEPYEAPDKGTAHVRFSLDSRDSRPRGPDEAPLRHDGVDRLIPRIVRQAGRELDLRCQPGTQAAWIQRQGPIVVTAASAEASAVVVEGESRNEKEHLRLRARKRPAIPRLGDPVRSGGQIPG